MPGYDADGPLGPQPGPGPTGDDQAPPGPAQSGPARSGPGQPDPEAPEVGWYEGEVPPEAERRLHSSAWSSGLSVNDFAACRHMGLRPVALVQGFCVMRWSWYGTSPAYRYGGAYGGGIRGMWGSGYPGAAGGGFGGPFGGSAGGYRGGGYSRRPETLSSYNCPHYYAGADHRNFGENFEQDWVSSAWAQGFNTAFNRMVEEARDAGAHGVIGVVDTVSSLIDSSIREFHVYGTAVAVEDVEPPPGIWTSYLGGQRLAKLIEAGFMPTSVVAAMASVRVWAVCVTESLMKGMTPLGGWSGGGGGEIQQISDAQMQARRLARDHLRSQLGGDTLHGADLEVGWRDVAEGDYQVDCILRGTRVRRYKTADPLPPPLLTVRLT